VDLLVKQKKAGRPALQLQVFQHKPLQSVIPAKIAGVTEAEFTKKS